MDGESVKTFYYLFTFFQMLMFALITLVFSLLYLFGNLFNFWDPSVIVVGYLVFLCLAAISFGCQFFIVSEPAWDGAVVRLATWDEYRKDRTLHRRQILTWIIAILAICVSIFVAIIKR